MLTLFARQTTRLRFTLLLTTLLGTAALLQNCKGPQGDPGPDGAAGINGTNGRDGNANVVYTTWKTPDWGNVFIYSQRVLMLPIDVRSSVLTSEALDRGLVHVYCKFKSIQYTGSGYELVDRVALATNNPFHYIKIPGRTTNEIDDFLQARLSVSHLAVNSFDPSIEIYISQYNQETGAYEQIPELVGQGRTFYQGLAQTMPQYRIVVAHGTTPARMKAIDWSDYEAVKKTFNLPD
jgi:hypothetical protein